MSEAKSCIKLLAFYYLLLAFNGVLAVELIPSVFLTNHMTSLFLPGISICLILSYYLRVAGQKYLKSAMIHLSIFILLFFLFRGLKYSVFGNVSAVGRFCWYLYYIPMLSIPLIFFYIALFVYEGDEKKVVEKWKWTLIPAVILILFILTNDFHQQIFSFQPGFVNWDGDYSYRWGFVVINIWEYSLYLMAVVILIARCSLAYTKRWLWLIFIPFSIGIGISLLLMTETMFTWNGRNVVQLPENLCVMMVAALECCIQLGLIPTNENSKKIFQISSLPVQIVNREGEIAYKSAVALDLSKEQILAPNGTRIEEHKVLHRMEIPGGYGIWQDDVTGLDCLNEELEEAKQRLSEEAEMIRLQNELEKERAVIEQRSFVYDTIARRTEKESHMISALADEARETSDPELQDRNRKEIVFLGAYIKRYANLLLLTADNDMIDIGELVLSFSEVLRYLNWSGPSVAILNNAEGRLSGSAAIAAFEAFQAALEDNIKNLKGAAVHVSDYENRFFVRMTLEGISKMHQEAKSRMLSETGIEIKQQNEEDITYISFYLPKGGEEK